jgi:hypothetical protein
MDSIEVKTWLAHSSNLYFVHLELEISAVTMRDSQIPFSFKRGFFPLITKINSQACCECSHLTKINCQALDERSRSELTLAMNGQRLRESSISFKLFSLLVQQSTLLVQSF